MAQEEKYQAQLLGPQIDDALSQMNQRIPEGWAVGQRDGVDVPPTSQFYHNNAKYYAEQAATSADAAEASAEEAAETAEATATEVAAEVAEEILLKAFVTDTASGATASFSDGADNIPVKSLTAQIVPVQDLHGQDYPYPESGNLFDGSTYGNVGLNYIEISSGTATVKTLASVLIKRSLTVPVEVGKTYRVKAGRATVIRLATFSTANPQYSTTSTNCVEATVTSDEYVEITAVNSYLFIQLFTTPTQPTGETPFETALSTLEYVLKANICPITGWTGANIFTENGWAMRAFRGVTSPTYNQNVTFTINWLAGQISAIRTASGNAAQIRSNAVTLGAGTYSLTGCPKGGSSSKYSIRVSHFTSEGVYVDDVVSDTGSGASFTLSAEDTVYIRVIMNPSSGTAEKIFTPRLVLSDVLPSYMTAALDWSTYGTVYGGPIEVVTGAGSPNLWVTNVLSSADLVQAAESVVRLQIQKSPGGGVTNSLPDVQMCSHYPVGGDNYPRVTYSETSSYVRFNFAFASAMTVEDFKTYLDTQVAAGTPVQVTIGRNLASFSVTPTPISTLKGDNNVWADCGDVSVDYRADTKLYIDKKIAETQALILENA